MALIEKIADLYTGIALYRVDIGVCVEQEKNANVMCETTYNQLLKNVSSGGRLESMPFGYIKDQQFHIISGHHRTRVAKDAGLIEIFVLVYTDELTKDEIISKQLSHNSLSGADDLQLLTELYDEIKDIDYKIASGIRDIDLKPSKEYTQVDVNKIDLDFDFKTVKLLFLSSQINKLDGVIAAVSSDDKVLIINDKVHDEFINTIKIVTKNSDVRNISSIFSKMLDIVKAHYEETDINT